MCFLFCVCVCCANQTRSTFARLGLDVALCASRTGLPGSCVVSFRLDAAADAAAAVSAVVAARSTTLSMRQCACSDGLLELLAPIFTAVQFCLSAVPAGAPTVWTQAPSELLPLCGGAWSQTPDERSAVFGVAPKTRQNEAKQEEVGAPHVGTVVFGMAL